jgi:hypothetical protein
MVRFDFYQILNHSIFQGATTSRTLQRTDLLHMPVVDINSMAHSDEPRRSNQNHRNSLNDESQIEYEYKLKQLQKHPSSVDNHNSSASDFENMHDDDEHPNVERRSSLLNESARRLLILGTIRPSRSFYRDLPAADAEYLMEYFRRMRITNRKVTSEEINQELKTKFTEYKPKICKLISTNFCFLNFNFFSFRFRVCNKKSSKSNRENDRTIC